MTAPPSALSSTLARVVVERGVASLDELQAMFPHLQRSQVQKALKNASHRGLIRCIKRGRGGFHVTAPSIWGASVPGVTAKKVLSTRERVASVWELGTGPRLSAWPTVGQGRRYQPLGSWSEA